MTKKPSGLSPNWRMFLVCLSPNRLQWFPLYHQLPVPAPNHLSPAHCDVLPLTLSNPMFVPRPHLGSILWKKIFVKKKCHVNPNLKSSIDFPCILRKISFLILAYRTHDLFLSSELLLLSQWVHTNPVKFLQVPYSQSHSQSCTRHY